MLSKLTFGAALVAVSASAEQQQFGGSVNQKWDEFKKAYGRKLSEKDELHRFRIFVENLETIEKMNVVDSKAKYTHMSPYADMTSEEFAALNTLQVDKQVLKAHKEKASNFKIDKITLPESFDWRTKGAVTPVKNQQQCGSCWAFATVANVEGNNFVTNGELKSLSEQELVDCSVNDNGCGGGLPSRAYEDMMESIKGHGFELESDYSYTAQEGTCAADPSKEQVYLKDWTSVSTDEDEIATALMKYGPLAIGINATPMQFYGGGISDPANCNPRELDHGVAIVGFGEEYGQKYWVIKNSWGASWGEDGYYRIVRGKGKCGVNTMVTTAIAKEATEQNIFV